MVTIMNAFTPTPTLPNATGFGLALNVGPTPVPDRATVVSGTPAALKPTLRTADLLPVDVGEKRTDVVQPAPAGRLVDVAQGGSPVLVVATTTNCGASGPVTVNAGGAVANALVLVIVTMTLALTPTPTLPNATGVGLALNVGPTPVPDRATVVSGTPATSKPTLRTADLLPVDVGEKRTDVVQPAPAGRLVDVAQGGSPVLVVATTTNCGASGPVTVSAGGAVANALVLVIVTMTLALTPTPTLPNATGLGLALNMGPTPVPDRATVVSGTPATSKPTLRTADLLPVDVGEKRTDVVQPAPAGKLVDVAQGGSPVLVVATTTNCGASGPVTVSPGGAVVTVLVLVIVTMTLALTPTPTLPNATGFGLAMNAMPLVTPVPESGTVAAAEPATEAPTFSTAVLAPFDVGKNWIKVAQAPPAESEAVVAQGGAPVLGELWIMNCPASGPVIPSAGTGAAAVPVLVMVTTVVALTPNVTFPKLTIEGATLNEPVPSWKSVVIRT